MVIAQITIKYHDDGALSVEGNIADTNLALALLDHAKDAVRGQRAAGQKLLVPTRDVDVPEPAWLPKGA